MQLLAFIFLLPLNLVGQRFSFMSESDADEFLKGILLKFGLTSDDIRIVSSTSVSNAAADIENGTRYIYYNPNWMRNIGSNYRNSDYWLKMGVITHEIGHHMKGHTIRDGGTNPTLELQADWWAGFAMRELGLTLDQALTAVQETTPNFSTSTHPARRDRVEAVTKGYYGESYQPGANRYNAPPPSSRTNTVTLGGESYTTRVFNGLTWMTKNLNYEVDGSWCFDNDPANCREYGRLYTWYAAKEACRALGWRLPTDQEWREMARQFGGVSDRQFGGVSDDASDDGKAAYQALIEGGSSGFNALLGGWRRRDGGFYDLGSGGGAYWSGTERDVHFAWAYYFDRGIGELYRDYNPKLNGYSCRCVQD